MKEEMSHDAILERIEGLRLLMLELRTENKEDHDGIKTRQDHTNGDVTGLKKWAWGVGGGIAVLSILAVPLMNSVLKVMDGQRQVELKLAQIEKK